MTKNFCKTLLVFTLMLSATNIMFAADRVSASKIFLFNYDPNSEAMGGTIASFSKNPLAFINSPSANFNVLSSRIDFSVISAFDGLYGGAAAFMFPTDYGNISVAAAYNDFGDAEIYTSNGTTLKHNAAFYLNYVFPLSSEIPVYTDKGGLGLTLKGYQFASEDASKISLAADFGGHYYLDMLLENLWAFAAFRNLGGNVEMDDDGTFDIPGNFNVALRYEIPAALGLAFTGDIIQFFSEGTGVAVGAEISPVFPVTFKAGWRNYADGANTGGTCGIFLNFDSFNIGYSFAAMTDDYKAKHTFNFGFMFGGISDQNKAFDYYLGYNFNMAKEAYKKKDYISARQQFEEILAIYPDHAASKEYLTKIIYDMDMYERSLEIDISKWLRRADLELHRNNLIKARSYYYKVLGIDPQNQEAEAGLAKVNERLARVELQENRKKNEKQIIQLWNEGMNYYNDGNFVFAKDKFKELLVLDPENAGALKYLGIIDTQVSKVTSMQSDQLFTQGMEYYNIGDYERAAKYFNAVYASDPSRKDAKDYYELSRKALNMTYTEISRQENLQAQRKTRLAGKDDSVLSSTQKVQKEMEIYYNQAIDYFNDGKYEDALKAFSSLREKAVRNNYYDLNQSIREYSAKAREALSDRYYKEGTALVKNDRLEESLDKFKRSLDYTENYQPAIKERENVMNTLAQRNYDAAIKAYASGNRKKALELLNKSLEYNPNKVETKKAIDRIKALGG